MGAAQVGTGAGAPGRREVLKVAGLGAVTITFLSGCGSGDGEKPAGGEPAPAGAEAKAAVAAAVSSGEIPVGGGKHVAEADVVITRPAATEYHVFSDVCPHQGGKVSRIDEKGRPVCPLHGSVFDPTTGAPIVGPAAAPLVTRKDLEAVTTAGATG